MTVVHLGVAYLSQPASCHVHTREGERLGIPEALNDEGSLQQNMKQEHGRVSGTGWRQGLSYTPIRIHSQRVPVGGHSSKRRDLGGRTGRGRSVAAGNPLKDCSQGCLRWFVTGIKASRARAVTAPPHRSPQFIPMTARGLVVLILGKPYIRGNLDGFPTVSLECQTAAAPSSH